MQNLLICELFIFEIEFRRHQVEKEIDKMPPTDGQVVLSTPPNSSSNNNNGGGTGGDSNAALAANSALSVPFSCNFCQRSFPRLSLLKKHEQVKISFSFDQTYTQPQKSISKTEPENVNQFVFEFFKIDRLTATRCRSAAISVCDSSSTRDQEIVTSNSTRAIKNIAANTARLPSHAGLFFCLLLLLPVSHPRRTRDKLSCKNLVPMIRRRVPTHQKPLKRQTGPFLNNHFFRVSFFWTSFDMTDYSSSTIVVYSLILIYSVFALFIIGNRFHISSKRFVKLLIFLLNNQWVTLFRIFGKKTGSLHD